MILKNNVTIQPVLCGSYIVSEEILQQNDDLTVVVNIDKNNKHRPNIVEGFQYDTKKDSYYYTGIWQRLPHKRFALIFRPYYRKEGN